MTTQELETALTECRDWLRDRILDIIPENDRPATQARINLANYALGDWTP